MPGNVLNLDGVKYELVKLRPYHFLENAGGIPFDVFDMSNQNVGVYAQMAADIEDKREEKLLQKEDIKRLKAILEAGIIDFNFEETIIDKGIEHIQELSNYVLGYSLETFKKVFKPDNSMLINCHYLAKNYGGRPIDYLNKPIDHYLFDFNCLVAGIKDENMHVKKAQKKG